MPRMYVHIELYRRTGLGLPRNRRPLRTAEGKNLYIRAAAIPYYKMETLEGPSYTCFKYISPKDSSGGFVFIYFY